MVLHATATLVELGVGELHIYDHHDPELAAAFVEPVVRASGTPKR